MCALTNTKHSQEPNSDKHIKLFEYFMTTINVVAFYNKCIFFVHKFMH